MQERTKLHYEKATPVPGWDKSLWPNKGRWKITARMEPWRILLGSVAFFAVLLAAGALLLAIALPSTGTIVLPEVLPFEPVSEPVPLAVAGGVLALIGAIGLPLALRLVLAKLWYTVRSVQFFGAPDPDYRAIDFRARSRSREDGT
jgi:hypothetical protein